MTAPFIHPHRIANCTKDWAAIGDDRPDLTELLRQSTNEREKRSDHIGTVLFILTVVVSYCLIASGAL